MFKKTDEHVRLLSVDYNDQIFNIKGSIIENIENQNINDEEKKESEFINSCKLLFIKCLVIISFSFFWTFNILKVSPEQITTFGLKLKKVLSHEGESTEEEEEHDAMNIMVLGPPWVYMRDVVNDLPVLDQDVTFFWTTEDSSSDTLKNLFSDCYDLSLSMFNDGATINLNDFERTEGITSSNIRYIATQFNEDNYGRMFSFFRHPYGIYLRKKQLNKNTTVIDNPMVRKILNQPDGKINFKLLGISKKFIREKCVVGLLDENLYKSVLRIASYLGFYSVSSSCINQYLNNIELDPEGELIELYSDEWRTFIDYYHYDLQLYEFARSVYRAQEQTIVSREKQMNLVNDDDE